MADVKEEEQEMARIRRPDKAQSATRLPLTRSGGDSITKRLRLHVQGRRLHEITGEMRRCSVAMLKPAIP